MATIIEVAYTRGDNSTLPGGVCLRLMSDGMYAAHHFSRNPGSSTPVSYYWGHYCDTLQKARQAYRAKLNRVEREVISAEEIAKERV